MKRDKYKTTSSNMLVLTLFAVCLVVVTACAAILNTSGMDPGSGLYLKWERVYGRAKNDFGHQALAISKQSCPAKKSGAPSATIYFWKVARAGAASAAR